MNIRPMPLRYLVKLSKPACETASGLALPETLQTNHTEGEVVAVGEGRLPGGQEHIMEADVEDVVIFQQEAFTLLEGDLGFVHEEDLVGVRYGDGIEPANDWVLIRPDPRPVASEGGIEIPEKFRRRGRSGRMENYGPGQLRHKGNWAGRRMPCDFIMLADGPILDRRAYWGKDALTVTVSGEVGRWTLVRAGDLVALEED